MKNEFLLVEMKLSEEQGFLYQQYRAVYFQGRVGEIKLVRK